MWSLECSVLILSAVAAALRTPLAAWFGGSLWKKMGGLGNIWLRDLITQHEGIPICLPPYPAITYRRKEAQWRLKDILGTSLDTPYIGLPETGVDRAGDNVSFTWIQVFLTSSLCPHTFSPQPSTLLK